MISKVTLFGCLVAVALARPDKPAPAPSGYGYSAPSQPLSYAPPAPAYSAPTPAYQAPEPAYSAPAPAYLAPQPAYSAPAPVYEKEEGMPFDFQYAVADQYKGLDFAHDAESDGDVVKGEYRVLLPDGRTQIVTYTADWENGYNAEVTYEGKAQYPEPQVYSAPAPAYSAPAPAYAAPAPSPAPAYSAPAPTYEQPRSLYSAP